MAEPAPNRFQVLVLNQISAGGLKRLPAESYSVGKDVKQPDAVLLRSADLHGMEIAPSVRAIARAGAGTNNIPVALMSGRGVPVFNAPGANANAVKELVLAGMLMASRNLAGALRFVASLDPALADMDKAVEDGKKAFAGAELAGQTLGIVGLGKIGCMVADVAIKLGMQVYGHDPHITVDAAWSLPGQVRKAGSVAEVLKHANFVTLHVPLIDSTRHLINADNVGLIRHDGVLLNFSREGVVDEGAVLAALDSKQ
ncbi:MAG: 3-phosphoglycerate dehydrogenase, partial [Rhizobacter sp.]|nr:3-phosphoglycerate dehydrogenase [Rhizobacter sp.]